MDKVLEEAKKILTKTFEKFKKNENAIGKELSTANLKARDEESIVGKCEKCKEGNLRIMYSKKNKQYFIACSNYPKCKNTFSVPKYCLPKATLKKCPACNFPIIKMIRKGKRPFEFCINPNCPKKAEWFNKNS